MVMRILWFDLFNQEEHLAIRARRKPEDPIDWDDYKGMRFTRAVSNLNIIINTTTLLLGI